MSEMQYLLSVLETKNSLEPLTVAKLIEYINEADDMARKDDCDPNKISY